MPPSGYSSVQSDLVVDFLTQCADALASESALAGRSPMAGLEKECDDIRRVVGGEYTNPFAVHVMELTRAFYVAVMERRPESPVEFRAAVDEVLADVSTHIQSIHIAQ